jgi:hypothetical protein
VGKVEDGLLRVGGRVVAGVEAGEQVGEEGGVRGQDGAMRAQPVTGRDDRHVGEAHRVAHRLHHVPNKCAQV